MVRCGFVVEHVKSARGVDLASFGLGDRLGNTLVTHVAWLAIGILVGSAEF